MSISHLLVFFKLFPSSTSISFSVRTTQVNKKAVFPSSSRLLKSKTLVILALLGLTVLVLRLALITLSLPVVVLLLALVLLVLAFALQNTISERNEVDQSS